jgi:hypothetical protein
MNDDTIEKAINIAKEMGEETGRNFASWVSQDTFGGRVTRGHKQAAQAIIEMDEDGDPAFWPEGMPNLSGEYAGEMTPAQLLEDIAWRLKIDPSDLFDVSDDICSEWEFGVSSGYQLEIVRLAKATIEE